MSNAAKLGVVHLICDDDAMREKLSRMLRAEGYEVRAHESAPRFLETADPEARGCVVAHVRLADMTGVELLSRMKAKRLDLPVIVVAAPDETGLAIQAMKEGAVDFIEKPLSEEALLAALRAALAKAAEPADRGRDRERHLEALASLTGREREVFNALIKGKSNETIAYQLGVSVKTVADHRARLMAKTHAQGVADLVRLAVHAVPVDDCA